MIGLQGEETAVIYNIGKRGLNVMIYSKILYSTS
ncbi:hypothetical protein ACVW0P_002260 [Mucilaginibacter sp. UYNi724]